MGAYLTESGISSIKLHKGETTYYFNHSPAFGSTERFPDDTDEQVWRYVVPMLEKWLKVSIERGSGWN